MILTNYQLDSALSKLVKSLENVNHFQWSCLMLLYSTGLRYIEAYEVNRWSIYNDNNFLVYTAKGSNPRIVNSALVPEDIQKAIFHNFIYFDYFRKNNLERFIREKFRYRNIMIGDKGCSSHLFRYNYIRRLYDSGMSISDIALNIGEVDLRNVELYVFNDIYSD